MGLLSSQIATRDMVTVCRHLATSYQAGIPILRGLQLASDNSTSKAAKEALADMAADIKNGKTLGASAQRQAKRLSPFFITLTDAGERGGRLDIMLRDLADYFEDRQRLQRSIVASMLYPVIMLCLAWVFGSFAFKILSMISFETMFDWNAFFMAYAVLQAKAVAVVAVVLAACFVLHRMGLFKWIWGWVVTYVWPLRPITLRFGLARFFRTFALLVGSGMNLPNCIYSSASVMVNPYLQRDMLQALPLVKNGATLVQSFAGVKCLTPTAREMLMVGEETGELDTSLMKLSEYHLAEARQAVKVGMTVMGILMILAVAGTVGFIYIKFFLTLYGKALST